MIMETYYKNTQRTHTSSYVLWPRSDTPVLHPKVMMRSSPMALLNSKGPIEYQEAYGTFGNIVYHNKHSQLAELVVYGEAQKEFSIYLSSFTLDEVTHN